MNEKELQKQLQTKVKKKLEPLFNRYKMDFGGIDATLNPKRNMPRITQAHTSAISFRRPVGLRVGTGTLRICLYMPVLYLNYRGKSKSVKRDIRNLILG